MDKHFFQDHKTGPTPSKYVLKPISPAEFCSLYAISRKTLLKWLRPIEKEIGPRQGNIYNVRQVALIFEKLGIPDGLFEG